MLKEMSIEIIRKCPNNCLHCSSNSSISCTDIISFDKFMEVIDGAIRLGLKTVCFSGGEPFLHPNIVDMIDYVYKKGLFGYIYTSGIYLGKNQDRTSIPSEILEQISSKVTKLIFNFQTANSATYNEIMGTENGFDLLKESVTNANRLGILCEAHFVPMKLNASQIESTIVLCKELGITKISFLRLVMHGRAIINADKIKLDEEETANIKKILNSIRKRDMFNIRIGVPLSEDGNKNRCEAARGKINIKYDGYVYPCEVFKNNQVQINERIAPESIHDNDIKLIYNDSIYLNTVRKYIKSFSGINTCENCVGQYFICSLSKVSKKSG